MTKKTSAKRAAAQRAKAAPDSSKSSNGKNKMEDHRRRGKTLEGSTKKQKDKKSTNVATGYDSDSSAVAEKVYIPATRRIVFEPLLLSQEETKLAADAADKLLGNEAEQEEDHTFRGIELRALRGLNETILAFLFHMLGSDTLLAKSHLDINLKEFAPLIESEELKILANSKVNDTDYRLRFRYMGGNNFAKDPYNKDSVELVIQFFKDHFNDSEWEGIKSCVTKARTLFVTSMGEQAIGEETIVSCMNFAMLGDHGIFINWLATSSELITTDKYGDQFTLIEARKGNWMHRGLASFLMKTARMVVAMHLAAVEKELSNFCIAVQASAANKEDGHRFYTQIGLTEYGVVTTSKEKRNVFPEFESCLTLADASSTDFVHFIENAKDILLFAQTNSSGTRTFRHEPIPEEMNFGRHGFQESLIVFPFNIIREHVLILSAGLDLLYHPFREDVCLHEFVRPEGCLYGPNDTCVVDGDERNAMYSGEGWPGEGAIDFVARWLELDGSTRASEHCFIAAARDITFLMYDNANETGAFDITRDVVHGLAKLGAFQKRWLVLPINVGFNHWILLSILHPLSLRKPQETEFSAYFLYDSAGATTRETDLTTMKKRGIMNLLIYANAKYGSSDGADVGDLNIGKLLCDESLFPKIGLHPKDQFEQTDNYSCAIHAILCMIEVSLVHSHKYSTRVDFESESETGNLRLKQGDMFMCYRNRKVPRSTVSLPPSFIKTTRMQITELWNRIARMKGSGVELQTLRQYVNLPGYSKHSFRTLVWQIKESDQRRISWHVKKSQNRARALPLLLGCKNEIINPMPITKGNVQSLESEHEKDSGNKGFLSRIGMEPVCDVSDEEMVQYVEGITDLKGSSVDVGKMFQEMVVDRSNKKSGSSKMDSDPAGVTDENRRLIVSIVLKQLVDDVVASVEKCDKTCNVNPLSIEPLKMTQGDKEEQLRAMELLEQRSRSRHWSLDILNLLSEKTVQFISGCTDSPNPMSLELQAFLPMMDSDRFKRLMNQVIEDNPGRQLHVHYVGSELEARLIEKSNARNGERDMIVDFFDTELDGFMDKPIPELVTRSRTLYITLAEAEKQTVVAAMNFAVFQTNGFYVSLLATRNVPLGEISWRNHHLSLFLMKLVTLACRKNMIEKKMRTTDLNIVMQVTNEAVFETSRRFLSRLGFYEVSKCPVEAFATLASDAESSSSDFFCHDFDMKESRVYVNPTGTFDLVQLSNCRIEDEFCSKGITSENGSLCFPINITRGLAHVLSSGLDIFYLPFQSGIDSDGHIRPNLRLNHSLVAEIIVTDRKRMAKDNSWWTNRCIDFFVRWLQMDGSTKASQYCSIGTTDDIQQLVADVSDQRDGTSLLLKTRSVVVRLARQGFFNKPWIIFPIFLGGNHWCVVGLLHAIYLNMPQERTFTAYFIYDSLKRTSRAGDAYTMETKGIFNFVACANEIFGIPGFTRDDAIAEKMQDPVAFPKIYFHKEDYIMQGDGHSCGVYATLVMLEMALVHCRKYRTASDFDQVSDTEIAIAKGDMFCLFRDKSNRDAEMIDDTPSLSREILDSVRLQTTILWNRLGIVVWGQPDYGNVSRKSNGFAPVVAELFETCIWKNADRNKDEIAEYLIKKELDAKAIEALLTQKEGFNIDKMETEVSTYDELCTAFPNRENIDDDNTSVQTDGSHVVQGHGDWNDGDLEPFLRGNDSGLDPTIGRNEWEEADLLPLEKLLEVSKKGLKRKIDQIDPSELSNGVVDSKSPENPEPSEPDSPQQVGTDRPNEGANEDGLTPKRCGYILDDVVSAIKSIDGQMFCVKLKKYHETYDLPRKWVIDNYGVEKMQEIVDQPESDFVDMQHPVYVTLDTRQVMKIRWVTRLNPREARSKNATDSYFLGMYKDRKGERLEEKYVNDMFRDDFIQHVIQRGNEGDPQFIVIPPGRPRIEAPLSCKRTVSAPVVKYQQNKAPTCLFYSFASALYYMGLEQPAKAVASIPRSVLNDASLCWRALIFTMQAECGWLVPHRIQTACFDPRVDQSEYPTAITLRGKDGSVQHAVTTVGRWIFDASCTHALPLTTESLNYCCSIDAFEGEYDCVYHGYRFKENENIKQKSLKLPKLKRNYI